MARLLARRVMAEKRRLLVPLALALAVNVAILALVVYPLDVKVRSGEERAAAAERALQLAEAEQVAAQQTLAGKALAEEELGLFYRDVLPADLAGARRITYLRLAEIANDTNLRVQRRVSEAKTGETLSRLEQTTVVEGEYENVRQFIYELETAPEFLVIENIALAEGSGIRSSLVLTLTVSTYFRAGDHGR
jgi:Tfp pilus assembly protein PilO